MTSSLRQIEANRRNARKSTGPKTPQGKAVVAFNALQHGLLSRGAALQGESEADLVDLGKRLRRQLTPLGELELLLVDRIVSTAWRLRRAIALETMLFDTERGDSSAYYGALAYKGDRDKLQLISRYELTLERSLYKALHELQRLQAERRGVPVPPPAAVDMTVEVAGAQAGETVRNGFVRQEQPHSGAAGSPPGRKPEAVAQQGLGATERAGGTAARLTI